MMANTLFSLELLLRKVDLEKFVKQNGCVLIFVIYYKLIVIYYMFSLADYFSLVLVGPYVWHILHR